jgi:hypothetical protein
VSSIVSEQVGPCSHDGVFGKALQLRSAYPGAGLESSCTVVPGSNGALQVGGQSIPGGLDVTRPHGVPSSTAPSFTIDTRRFFAAALLAVGDGAEAELNASATRTAGAARAKRFDDGTNADIGSS